MLMVYPSYTYTTQPLKATIKQQQQHYCIHNTFWGGAQYRGTALRTASRNGIRLGTLDFELLEFEILEQAFTRGGMGFSIQQWRSTIQRS
jgi:hypothetical protein